MGGLARTIFHPVRAIQEYRTKKAFQNIKSEDIRRLKRGKRALNAINTPLSLHACTKLLDHTYSDVREWAAEQVGSKMKHLREKEKLNGKTEKVVYYTINQLLKSDEPYMREAGIDTIRAIGDPAAIVEAAALILNSEKVDYLIVKTINMLGHANTGQAEQMLLKMLRHGKFEAYRKPLELALSNMKIED